MPKSNSLNFAKSSPRAQSRQPLSLHIKSFFKYFRIWSISFIKSTYQVNYAWFIFVRDQTLAFVNEQELREHPFDIEPYKTLSSVEIMQGLLPLGWAIGLLIGTGTLLTLSVGLILKHSSISFYRTIVYRINAAFKDMYVMENGEKKPYEPIFIQKPSSKKSEGNENTYQQRNKKQLTLGVIGRITGFILGTALFILIVIGRMIWNTPEHIYRSFCRGVRAMLKENTSLHDFFKLEKDKRAQPHLGYGASYALGILGIFPLGLVSGCIGIAVGIILRTSTGVFTYCSLKKDGAISIKRKTNPADTQNEAIETVPLLPSNQLVLKELISPQETSKKNTEIKHQPHLKSPIIEPPSKHPQRRKQSSGQNPAGYFYRPFPNDKNKSPESLQTVSGYSTTAPTEYKKRSKCKHN